MDPVNVIYFTKEDGQNKLLLGSYTSITSVADIGDDQRQIFEKILGHKPSNIYVLVDGVELRMIPHNHPPEYYFPD